MGLITNTKPIYNIVCGDCWFDIIANGISIGRVYCPLQIQPVYGTCGKVTAITFCGDKNQFTIPVDCIRYIDGTPIADPASLVPSLDAKAVECKQATNGVVVVVDPNPNTEDGKCFVQEVYRVNPDNPKEKIAIHYYKQGETLCAYLATDTELLTNIINDPIMSNNVGIPQELEPKVTGGIPFEFCPPDGLVGTLQDLFDFLLTDPNFVLKDGTKPDGLIELELDAEYKGSTNQGKKTTAQGFELGAAPNIISYDGGQGTCWKKPWCDGDCDGLADMCVDLTTPLVIPAGAGISGIANGALCDDDPTTTAPPAK